MRIRRNNAPIHLVERAIERVRHGESMGTPEMMEVLRVAELTKMMEAATNRDRDLTSQFINVTRAAMRLREAAMLSEAAFKPILVADDLPPLNAESFEWLVKDQIRIIVIPRGWTETFKTVTESPSVVRYEVGFWAQPDSAPRSGDRVRLIDLPYKNEITEFKVVSATVLPPNRVYDERAYVNVWGY